MISDFGSINFVCFYNNLLGVWCFVGLGLFDGEIEEGFVILRSCKFNLNIGYV